MPRLLPYSLRNQLLLFLAIGLGLLAVFCFPLWRAWNVEIEAGRAELLHAEAERMRRVFDERGRDALATLIEDRVGTALGPTHQVMLLAGPDGRRIAGNLDFTPAPPASPHADGSFTLSLGGGRATLELLRVPLADGATFWVGRDITRFERLEAMFVRGMAGSAVLALLAAGMATAAARRSMLERIHRINRASADIIGGNLARRLPLSARDDEFDLLAGNVNRMLEQIEHLVENVRHSSNAIAHDLRTPLAELRAHLEHLAVTRPPYEEVQEGLDVAIADVDRVIGIFNAILRLAEIDSGTRRAGFRHFDAAAVLGEAAEFYEPLAEDRGVALAQHCEPGLLVRGDPVLLAQALGNLIDNAIKYAAGSAARPRIVLQGGHGADGWIELAVGDNGPGIAPADRARAGEPFFRADWSRATPGVGLGLTLVEAVARLHGGRLELLDNGPGLRALLRLPPPERRA
jgi:signal transduction histidine kinase